MASRRDGGRHRAAGSLSGAENRRITVLVVRWSLVSVALGLMLTAEPPLANWLLGFGAVATLAASNIALGRSRPESIEGIPVSVGIALLDALLLVTAWYASGHESFIAVIVGLGVLNLALAGVNLTELVAIALAAAIAYLVAVQIDEGGTFLESSPIQVPGNQEASD